MAVFSEEIALAKELITEYGMKCIWYSAGDRDPDAKPWRGSETSDPVPHEVVMAFFPNGGDNSIAAAIAAIADTDVNITSEYALMPAVDFDISNSDIVTTLDGSPIEIVKMTALNPNGEVIFWKLWVER